MARTVLDANISETEARSLLDRLCVRYGFCLSPLWHARLQNNPPNNIEKFTDTVFQAEGLNPRIADSELYKAVQAEVRQAFIRSAQGLLSNDS